MTATVGGAPGVVSLSCDIAWLLIPVAIAVTERRRGASWSETFLWFLVAFLRPVVGLVIRAIYRTAVARPPASR